MIIGIDGNEANVERKVGISEYSFELLRKFKEFKISNLKFQIYLKNKPREELPKERDGWKYIIVKPRRMWTQVGLPLYLFTHFPRPDVFFSPTHYAPRFAPMPTAIAIMDLSFLRFPHLFAKKDLYQLVRWTRYSAKQAAKVFTISETSKNDILKEYEKEAGDVIVTYPGIKEISQPKADGPLAQNMSNIQLQKKYGISSNYILFVGTLQPRKNIARLIEAFSLMIHDKGLKIKELQLVIVGKKGWLYEDILAAPKKYGIEKEVKFLDFVSTEDLPSLYKNTLVFVLPSLYEGFGLPVVEAMQYGCPVITSNVSSLPEAGGDAALYVDPKNVEDIAEKIEKVISDAKLRKSMVEKGYKHIKKFSWEKAAKETLQILVKLGENG